MDVRACASKQACRCGIRTVSTTLASDTARASPFIKLPLDEPGLPTEAVDFLVMAGPWYACSEVKTPSTLSRLYGDRLS